jgi:hypothetical protein
MTGTIRDAPHLALRASEHSFRVRRTTDGGDVRALGEALRRSGTARRVQTAMGPQDRAQVGVMYLKAAR